MHQAKIVALSKLTVGRIGLLFHAILRQVEFLNETIIEPAHWEEAQRLTAGVDNNDLSFVALTLKTGGWLCMGSKKLTNHLHERQSSLRSTEF